jgi:hypothetical protein
VSLRENIGVILYLLSASWALFAAARVIVRERSVSRGRCRSCAHGTSVAPADGIRRCAECGEPWLAHPADWRRHPAVVYALNGLTPGAVLFIGAFLMYPVMTALLPRSVVASLARAEWELGQREGPWMIVAAVRSREAASLDGFNTLALRIVEGRLDRAFSLAEQVLLARLLADPETPRSAVKRMLNASVKIVVSPVDSPIDRPVIAALDRRLSFVWSPMLQSTRSSGVTFEMYSRVQKFDVGTFRVAIYNFSPDPIEPIRQMVHVRDIADLIERINGAPAEDDGRSGIFVVYRIHISMVNGEVAQWAATARVPLERLRRDRAGFEWPFDFEYDALGIKPRANTGEDVEPKP